MGINTTRPKHSFWSGKRVVVTGHTGFKGTWLTLWLNKMGSQVTGIGLPPNTSPSLFELVDLKARCNSHFCDIRNAEAIATHIVKSSPDIVFHLAAQPLVRPSYMEPLETFSTNVMGSANLLDALRGSSTARVVVMVTTDKVYSNNGTPWPYRENDTLGGHDPYSASKAASEIIIESYRKAFLAQQGIALASARAGNVIGGGDWSEDRLLPDAVRAWQTGESLEIRRPQAIRPWQHVLEALAGYLVLAQKLWETADLAGAYNFGPPSQDAATVRDVIELAREAYGKGEVNYREDKEGPHEADGLTLETAKARLELGFQPHLSLVESVQLAMAWYRSQYSGNDPRRLCEEQITAYESAR